MRTLLPLITLSLLAFGCQPKQPVEPLVIGDSTPIVAIAGASHTTTETLGIEMDGVFLPLIRPGNPVPCSFTIPLRTDTDDQPEILVSPSWGTGPLASNHPLGRFQIVGIEPEPAGKSLIDFTLTITERQILLSARDVSHQADLEIRRVSGDTKP
jgi:molecular chaperone DnaK (HSP70)